jgi:Adenylate and Guanylate cyclase catalytic domain
MSTAATSDARFQIGHVLFIDMVGYSKLLINEQTRLLRELNELVQGTDQFRAAEKKHRLVRVATGDGMALVFRDSPELPVRCALEISSALQKQTSPPLIRMGIHSGLVNEVTDVNNRKNVAGAGINIAQRVMDCGDAGHILLSKHVAEDLEHHARWRPFLHDLGQCEVKHGNCIALVNLYSSEAGNPQLPEKIRQIRKKRAANSVLLFSTTAALGLVIVASSWFFSTHFPKPEAVIPKRAEATTPVTTPMATATSAPDLTFANTRLASSVWSQPPQPSPISRPRKLFAGTWRGTVHSVGPQSTWDSQLELNIDETETQWSNMTGGSVSRHGRTLIYRRSYKLGNSTSVQVQATLILHEDDRAATYTTRQTSITGKSRSVTSGRGTLEKVD